MFDQATGHCSLANLTHKINHHLYFTSFHLHNNLWSRHWCNLHLQARKLRLKKVNELPKIIPLADDRARTQIQNSQILEAALSRCTALPPWFYSQRPFLKTRVLGRGGMLSNDQWCSCSFHHSNIWDDPLRAKHANEWVWSIILCPPDQQFSIFSTGSTNIRLSLEDMPSTGAMPSTCVVSLLFYFAL